MKKIIIGTLITFIVPFFVIVGFYWLLKMNVYIWGLFFELRENKIEALGIVTIIFQILCLAGYMAFLKDKNNKESNTTN